MAGYQAPMAGYPVPPGGYHVPPGAFPIPAAGYHAQARVSSAMRAASADRERAVDVLKAGFAEGRLTQDEYNERIGRAYAARTYGELTALTADLPAGAWYPAGGTWYPPGGMCGACGQPYDAGGGPWCPAGWYPEGW